MKDSDPGVERTQWRFMWRGTHGDERGAQWRDELPDADEIEEWREDFRPGAVWVETRRIVEYAPRRVDGAL